MSEINVQSFRIVMSRLPHQFLSDLEGVDWVVYAACCGNPNPKLKRLLLKRGFVLENRPEFGEAYFLSVSMDPLV